jgi:hypothetical protein
LVHGGIVGYELPPLRVSTVEILPGDMLVFATDGVWSYFDPAPLPHPSAQEVADRLLAGFRKENDDSLVVVARFLGSASDG